MSEAILRECYRPSGRFKVIALFFWGLAALLTAAAMGIVLYQAQRAGMYIIGLAPILAALIPGGMVYLAVRQSHSRNRLLAGALGLVAGLVLYLGSYQAGLVHIIGLRNAHRVDILPRYIRLRMRTDVVHDVGAKPPPARVHRPERVVMNWVRFGLELSAVCAFLIFTGVTRAKFPYSEAGQRWMRQEVALFPPDTGEDLIEALEEGTLSDWVQQAPERTSVPLPSCSVTLHYDPRPPAEDEALVYLTVTETQSVKQGLVLKRSIPKAQTLLKRVRLTTDEVRALEPIFAGLTALRPPQPAPRPATAIRGGPAMRVEPVAEPYAGQVLSPGHRSRCLFFALIVLLPLVAGLGLLVAAVVVGLGGFRVGPVAPVSLAVLCGFAGMLCLGSLTKFPVAVLRYHNRLLYRSACRRIAARPEVLVDPGASDAIFVDVVPRSHWTKANRMLETASDVGFLRVDPEGGMLLFEGDRERYWIPADAILSCEVEQVESLSAITTQTDYYPHFVAVVHANHPEGPREVPLAVRYDAQDVFSRSHQARARELHALIHSIRPAVAETEAL